MSMNCRLFRGRLHSTALPLSQSRSAASVLLVIGAMLTASCGLITPPGGDGIQVNVSPATANVLSGQTQTFTASVTGTDNPAVTWSVSAGTITSGGIFTAPVVNASTNVSVTATSKVDLNTKGGASVVVQEPTGEALSITTASLPDGQTGDSYDAGFSASGGTPPYSWTVSQGNIPPGLSLSPTSGDLAGMPGTVGDYSFYIRVADAKAQSAQKAFTVKVAAGGAMDGPAELPRVSVSSAMADTPAPGSTIFVNAGGDFQAALNRAHCGDTIQLQAGATFSGTFDFPAKACDNNHWIIVRTSALDSSLPAEGQRMTPCYAGVTSLPGRPQYPCASASKVLAKLQLPGPSGILATFLSGANHYRLLGLEITRPAGVKERPPFWFSIQVPPGTTSSSIESGSTERRRTIPESGSYSRAAITSRLLTPT